MVGRAREEAWRAVPCFHPTLRLRSFPPAPRYFPFLRHYARYCTDRGPRLLVARWLAEAGRAWIQEVWVVHLGRCSDEARDALMAMSYTYLLRSDLMGHRPYLYVFGCIPFSDRSTERASVRHRLRPYRGATFTMFRIYTGQTCTCSVNLLGHYRFLGTPSSHPPVRRFRPPRDLLPNNSG